MSAGTSAHDDETVRILVIEDSDDDWQLIQSQLTFLGHLGDRSPDLATALTLAEADDYDVIMLDLGLPDVREPLDGVRSLAGFGPPVVVITNRNDAELALAALDSGASQYLVKQRLDVDRLDETIRDVIADPRGSRGPTLAVEDLTADIEDALVMLEQLYEGVTWAIGLGDSHLDGHAHEDLAIRLGLSADALHRAMMSFGWNAVDLDLHGALTADEAEQALAPGAERLRSLRMVVLPVGAPMIVGTVVGVIRAETTAIDLTAARLQVRHLDRAVRREQALIDAELRAETATTSSLVDALTGLLNRRGFDRVLLLEEKRAAREQDRDESIFVIDLDDLKRVNDTEGHGAGDRLIRLAADTLDHAVRGSDQVFRIGGDEFVVFASQSSPPGASVIEDRLRSALDASGIAASVGGAIRTDGTLIETFGAADAAMYRDKQRRKGAS